MSLVTKGLKVLGRGGEKKAARKGAEELAVRKAPVKPKAPVKSDLTVPRKAPAAKPKPKPKALPAPEKRLALPAPGPGLPDYAAKPRGGQWWIDRPFHGTANYSPEGAARTLAAPIGIDEVRFTPEADTDFDTFWADAQRVGPRQEWLQRALTKYFKNDFGSPEDPLRDLAARGLHYDAGMTPERWSETVNRTLQEDNLQHLLFPPNDLGGMPGAGDDLRGETLSAMPWLAKVPATDNVYGINPHGLDLSHFYDEFNNAFNHDVTGLPADLAVRPESLARMSFPQAVERVGRINQWRAKEADRAALSALDSPAIQVFKEYPENNPGGLRWVELRAPEDLPEGWKHRGDETMLPFEDPEGSWVPRENDPRRTSLQEALKYEGDVMGHCVGGYCDDVLSGRSRIFSLRDARGEPHVTIETAPRTGPSEIDKIITRGGAAERLAGIDPALAEQFRAYYAAPISDEILGKGFHGWLRDNAPELADRYAAELTPRNTQNIVQIKGKQNQAPKADYLPYVQDFVKSGQWGEIGDFANTGLVRLPDQRLVSGDQWRQGIRRALIARNPVMPDARLNQIIDQEYPDPGPLVSDQWDDFAPYFEGFAVGGRVRNNLAARGGR